MFGSKVLDLNKPYTMRGLLSTTASVFDPLNFPAPGDVAGQTDNASSVVQNPMEPTNQWGDFDEMGEMEEQSLFFLFFWKNNLHLLKEINVPHCYLSRLDTEGVKLQLHHFCDTSEVGYGTASYLCIEYVNGFTECAFVIGKSRNAPFKTVSIPRPELHGALLAARMDSTIRKELDFKFVKVINLLERLDDHVELPQERNLDVSKPTW